MMGIYVINLYQLHMISGCDSGYRMSWVVNPQWLLEWGNHFGTLDGMDYPIFRQRHLKQPSFASFL
jgi:hypothetical protein